MRHTFLLALTVLALFGRTAVCQPEGEDYDESPYAGDDDGDYGGSDYGGDDYGGGEEEPPPPSGGGATELATVEELDAFIDNEDASIVGAFLAKEMQDPEATLPEGWDPEEDGEWVAPTIENPALTSFNEITGALSYRFAYTTAPEVLAKLKSKAGGLYLFRSPKFVSAEHGDRPRERFPSDKLSESAVTNWLQSKAQPLVGLFSTSTSTRNYATGAVLVVFMNLDFDVNAKGVKYVLKRARKAAAALKGKLSVAVAKLSDMTYELTDYGLESKKPTSDILMGIKANKPGGQIDYYGTETAFSAAALTEFAQSYLDGKLKPHVRPDPPPYEGGEGGENEGEGSFDDDVSEEDEESKDEM